MQILFFVLISSLAFAGEEIKLTPGEKAIAKQFLRKRPRYRGTTKPDELAKAGKGEEDWESTLTEDSYYRLLKFYPKLAKKVEQGRAFRKEYIDSEMQMAESWVFHERGFVRNLSGRLLASYMSLLRKHQAKKEAKVDPKIAKNQSRERARIIYQYPPGTSDKDWSLNALRTENEEFLWLSDQTDKNRPSKELPREIYIDWINAQRAEIKAAMKTTYNLSTDGQSEFMKAYTEGLRQERYAWYLEIEHTLNRFNDPKVQRQLVQTLQGYQFKENETLAAVEKKLFGSPERIGGKLTSVADDKLQWISDLAWDGYQKSEFYKQSQLSLWQRFLFGKPIQDKRNEGDFAHWSNKFEAMYQKWPLRRAPIKKILKPEEYKKEWREWWKQKIDKAKRVAKWTAAVGTIGGALTWAGFWAHKNWPQWTTGFPNPGALVDTWKTWEPGATPKGPPPEASGDDSLSMMRANNEPSNSWGPKEGAGPARPLFKITPNHMKPENIPTFFNIADLDDAAPKEHMTSTSGKIRISDPKARPQFTITSTVKNKPVDGVVTLLHARGFFPIPEVWGDGKPLRQNVDYVLVENHFAKWLELAKEHHDESIVTRATYYVNPFDRMYRQDFGHLPAVNTAEVEWLSKELQQMGEMKLSHALEELIKEKAMLGEDIRADEIRDRIRTSTKYEFTNVSEGPKGDGLFFTHKPYLKNGIFCFDCDGAAHLEKIAFDQAWRSKDLTHNRRTGFRRDDKSMYITRNDSHGLLITEHERRDQYILDATPYGPGIRQSPQEVFVEEEQYASQGMWTRLLNKLKSYFESDPEEKQAEEKKHEAEKEVAAKKNDKPKGLAFDQPKTRISLHAAKLFHDLLSQVYDHKFRFEGQYELVPRPPKKRIRIIPPPEKPNEENEESKTKLPKLVESKPHVEAEQPVEESDAIKIRRLADKELAARKARNNERARRLAKLDAYRTQLVEIETTSGLKGQKDTTAPNEVAKAMAAQTSEFVHGRIPNLVRFVEANVMEVPDGVPTTIKSLAELVKKKLEDLKKNYEAMKAARRTANRLAADRHPDKYHDSDVVRGSNQIFDYLQKHNWSPMESLDYNKILEQVTLEYAATHQKDCLAIQKALGLGS